MAYLSYTTVGNHYYFNLKNIKNFSVLIFHNSIVIKVYDFETIDESVFTILVDIKFPEEKENIVAKNFIQVIEYANEIYDIIEYEEFVLLLKENLLKEIENENDSV